MLSVNVFSGLSDFSNDGHDVFSTDSVSLWSFCGSLVVSQPSNIPVFSFFLNSTSFFKFSQVSFISLCMCLFCVFKLLDQPSQFMDKYLNGYRAYVRGLCESPWSEHWCDSDVEGKRLYDRTPPDSVKSIWSDKHDKYSPSP
jgi:hypothetical protein